MKQINFKKYKDNLFELVITLLKIVPSEIYLKLMYARYCGGKLNLKDPRTLNEKLQWKKIYDKKSIYTLCADKYEVRNYIKKKIGGKYLIPLLHSTNDLSEIHFGKISPPFIIKTSHGSGQCIIVRNKDDVHKKIILKKCKKWLKCNHYWIWREPQYKNIKPLILIEKLLLNKKGQIPEDYKFHCFNGKVEFITVNTDRFEKNPKMSFFDANWKLLPFTWCPAENGKPIWGINKKIKKPRNLNEMIKISKKLSKNFDYVRVDLYSLDNKIYFGELTLHPGAGLNPFSPDKYDLIYGNKLKLDKK
jgi:TupA-like ATPgrasp